MKYYQLITYFVTFLEFVLFLVYRKDKIKYYFAFVFLSDIIGLLLWKLFQLSGQIVWLPFNFLMLFAIDKSFFEKHFKKLFIASIPLFILNYFLSNEIQQFLVLIIGIILIIIFMRLFIIKLLRENKINLLYLGLGLDNLILTFDLAIVLINVSRGLDIFFAGLIFQIIIYTFLIFIRNNYEIKLKSHSSN